jgi:hypothetical protein
LGEVADVTTTSIHPTAAPESEHRELRARVDQLERECGCQSGALAGFTALALYLVSLVVFGSWPGGWLIAAAVGFVAFLLAVGVGKHVALARAAQERDTLITALERHA